MTVRNAAALSEDEVDLLLHWLAIIIRGDTVTPWERKLIASVLHASRRPSKRGPWQPTVRQLCIMRRLVAAFREATLGSEDDEGRMTE